MYIIRKISTLSKYENGKNKGFCKVSVSYITSNNAKIFSAIEKENNNSMLLERSFAKAIRSNYIMKVNYRPKEYIYIIKEKVVGTGLLLDNLGR